MWLRGHPRGKWWGNWSPHVHVPGVDCWELRTGGRRGFVVVCARVCNITTVISMLHWQRLLHRPNDFTQKTVTKQVLVLAVKPPVKKTTKKPSVYPDQQSNSSNLWSSHNSVYPGIKQFSLSWSMINRSSLFRTLITQLRLFWSTIKQSYDNTAQSILTNDQSILTNGQSTQSIQTNNQLVQSILTYDHTAQSFLINNQRV